MRSCRSAPGRSNYAAEPVFETSLRGVDIIFRAEPKHCHSTTDAASADRNARTRRRTCRTARRHSRTGVRVRFFLLLTRFNHEMYTPPQELLLPPREPRRGARIATVHQVLGGESWLRRGEAAIALGARGPCPILWSTGAQAWPAVGSELRRAGAELAALRRRVRHEDGRLRCLERRGHGARTAIARSSRRCRNSPTPTSELTAQTSEGHWSGSVEPLASAGVRRARAHRSYYTRAGGGDLGG